MVILLAPDFLSCAVIIDSLQLHSWQLDSVGLSHVTAAVSGTMGPPNKLICRQSSFEKPVTRI